MCLWITKLSFTKCVVIPQGSVSAKRQTRISTSAHRTSELGLLLLLLERSMLYPGFSTGALSRLQLLGIFRPQEPHV